MASSECEFLDDVLEAVRTGRWSLRPDETLRAHVTACAACRDLALVASALLRDGEETRTTCHVPDAGVVWRRARLEARRQAARSAARPVLVAHALAVASLVGLILGLGRPLWAWFASMWGASAWGSSMRILSALGWSTDCLGSVGTLEWTWPSLQVAMSPMTVLALAPSLLLASVALCLMIARE